MKSDLNHLQHQLDDTLIKRSMKNFKLILNNFIPNKTLEYIHLISFYMLPAIPAPPSSSSANINLISTFAPEKVINHIFWGNYNTKK